MSVTDTEAAGTAPGLYYSFDLPDILVPITTFIVAAGLVLVAYEVFWKNFRERGQAPGINMVVPFVALYVWWLPVSCLQPRRGAKQSRCYLSTANTMRYINACGEDVSTKCRPSG